MPLFIVIGVAGAGRSSLVAQAKAEVKTSPVYHFVPVLATHKDVKETSSSPEQTFQEEVVMSDADFMALRDNEGLAVSWKEKLVHCGLRADVRNFLADGKKVVVCTNLYSLPDLQQAFPDIDCTVIAVTCSAETLVMRKMPDANAHTHQKDLKKMSKHVNEFYAQFNTKGIEGALEIDNNGTIEQGTSQLLAAMGFDAETEIPPPDENDLQNCLPQDFLKRTIFPVLAPGLNLLETVRPPDPVTFLAMYLYRSVGERKQKVAEMEERKKLLREMRTKIEAEYTLEGRI